MSEEKKNIERDNQEQTGRDEKGRYMPGISGNPKGRPKNLVLSELLREELENKPEGQKEEWKLLFIRRLLQKAIGEGDSQALKLIMNYVDGMPKQEIGFYKTDEVDEAIDRHKEIIEQIRGGIGFPLRIGEGEIGIEQEPTTDIPGDSNKGV